MIKGLGIKLGVIAALTIGSTTASAAVVNGSYVINSAVIADLYSATFDGSLINNAPDVPTGCLASADVQQCNFFGGDAPAPRAISIVPLGHATGSLNVQYESTTGEILMVNSLEILLPKVILTITSGGHTIVTVDPADLTAPGLTFIRAGTLGLPAATADADQGVAVGQVNIFQHNASPNLDAPDFATFSAIVDLCQSGPVGGPYVVGGGLCGLLGILSLDGNKYRLEGTVNALGGDSLVMKAQTGNNSIYRVDFTTSVVPVPAAVWLFGSALGLLGLARRRLSK